MMQRSRRKQKKWPAVEPGSDEECPSAGISKTRDTASNGRIEKQKRRGSGNSDYLGFGLARECGKGVFCGFLKDAAEGPSIFAVAIGFDSRKKPVLRSSWLRMMRRYLAVIHGKSNTAVSYRRVPTASTD